MTAQELKNSILQYAVQGKLVPQDPSDEPASVLLERIKSEKQQLIKDKKIKAEKPLTPITEEEIPFEIPESWEWVRLGDLCDIINGFTPLRTKSEFWSNGTISWFTVADIHLQGRIITKTSQHINEIAIGSESKRILPENSILLCCTASIGEFALTKIPLTTNQQFNGLVIKDSYKLIVSHDYLFAIAPMFKNALLSLAGKTTFNFVSVKKTETLLIPLPPLAEQQRIVAKIEELMPLVEEYDKAEKELTELNAKFPEQIKKSVLQYAIQGKLVAAPSPLERAGGEVEPASELLKRIKAEKQKLIKEKKIKAEKPLPPITEEEIPFEIPESWVWVRLGEIAEVSTGATPLTTNSDYYLAGTIPWVTSSLTGNLFVEKADSYITEKAISETNCKVYPIGTLLVAMYGQGKTRGQITELKIEAATNQACAAINLHIKSDSLRKYVKMHFQKIYTEIRELAHGGAQPNLNLTKIKDTLIPLPPLAEQQRIVEKVEEVLGVCEGLK